MSRLTHTAICIGFTSVLLSALNLLFKYSDPVPNQSVDHTIYISALVILSTTLYYVIFEIIRLIAPASLGLRRRDYTDYEEAASHEEDDYTPRLTMQIVMTMVFGLGLVFFVFTYAFTGQQLFLTYGLLVGFSITSIRDVAMNSSNCVLDIISIILVSISGWLVIYDNQQSIDFNLIVSSLFSICIGMVFPLISPVILYTINIQRDKVGLHRLMEFCEYGLPFAFIIATRFLVNPSTATLIPSQDIWFLVLLAPPLLVPVVIFITVSVFKENSFTPLLSLALVFAGRSLLCLGLSSYLSLLALLAAKLAVLARFFSVSIPDPPPPETLPA